MKRTEQELNLGLAFEFSIEQLYAIERWVEVAHRDGNLEEQLGALQDFTEERIAAAVRGSR